MNNQTAQWIHLDLKGIIPAEPRLIEWLSWLRERGFEGVVFEYEDRIPWETWPGTFRPGYDLAAWRRIWGHCAGLGLEVVPLIQTFGHLEWLLKHDRYAALREASHWNLLCPQHEQVGPFLERWIDEVISLHPGGRYVHVGLDEVHHLASCPRCAAGAQQSPDGPLRVYMDHARRITEHVRSRGRLPIVWGDMVLSNGKPRLDLIKQLPDGTVLCDWRYRSSGPIDSVLAGPAYDRPFMGTSAIRCGFDPVYELVAPQAPRLENVRGWQRLGNTTGGKMTSILHTTWGRSRSLMPLYGPWEGWLPGFIAAGRPGAALSPAMTEGIKVLDAGLETVSLLGIREAIEAMKSIASDDPLEQQALRWWTLALRHRQALWWAEKPLSIGHESLMAVQRHIGVDPAIVALKQRERESTLADLAALEQDIRAFWRDNQLSDEAEYIDSHIHSVARHLRRASEK